MRYLSQSLIFDDSSIYFINEEDKKEYVMMDWEDVLMKKHADIVCHNQGDILEIGFGMGISANYIQANNPKSHTIIENHPQVLEKAVEWAKDKPNVIILAGSWRDKLNDLNTYDGVFYDTYGDDDFKLFSNHVSELVKSGGVFSWWNNMDKEENVFDLSEVIYEEINVTPTDNSYYNSSIYYLPKKHF